VTCCVHKLCWVISTSGLCSVGQDELLFIFELNENLADEKFPKQILLHIIDIYERASKSERVYSMNYSLYKFNQSKNETELFDSKDNIGFLYYAPLMKFNCFENIEYMLPQTSFLIGILLQKWEVPWAKLFPLRLLLAFGANYKQYPCTQASVRQRKPIYSGDIGHTIMNILCDLRNYQYTIPQINGK
jgi:MAD (mothers against decapentaplegic) interacting protein